MYAMMRFSPQMLVVRPFLLLGLSILTLQSSAQRLPSREIAGTPWSGHLGITETVSQIMKRQGRKPKRQIYKAKQLMPVTTI